MRDRGAPAYYIAVRRSGKGAKAEYVDLSTKVESIRYHDTERKADVLSIVVDNFYLENFDDPTWTHGNLIQFAYGYESGLTPMREGVIRGVKGAQKLQIEVHGKAVIMDRVKIREKYKNTTRSEIIEKIARRNGYGPETTFIQKTSERFEVLTQPNLTDAQMCRKHANLEGFEFYVDFDGFHWHERKLDKAPIRELIFYTDPGQGDIISFDITNDITRKPARVRVKSRDPLTKKTISARADNSTETDAANLQEGKPTEEFRTYVDAETGNTTDKTVPLEQPTAHEDDRASNGQTEAEVKTEAKRRYRKGRQRAVEATVDIIGDERIVAKSVVLISGWGTRLSGKYYVIEVTSDVAGGGGFGQQLKVITDGYQKKSGGKPNKGPSTDDLKKLLIDLTRAGAQMESATIRAAAERFGRGALKILSANPKGDDFARLATGALKYARVIQGQSMTLSAGDQQKAGPLINQVADFGGKANELADSTGGTNRGKLNKKDVKDPNELTQKTTVDEETGDTTTKFSDKGGRDD